jgi:Coenzyme PQQ synthesis protein D (PqqD)
MSTGPDAQPPPTGSTIAGSTILSRSASVLTAEVDGEIVMMSIEHSRYYALNETGGDIWRRIDPPCSFDELVDALASEYAVERATIAADVRALLEGMLARGAVTLS